MFLNHFALTTHPFAEKPPIEWLLRDERIDQALARLKFFEQNLDPQKYIRVHRSFIVNIAFIRKLENYNKDSYLLILINDDKINISRSGLQLLRKVLYI